MGPKSCGPWLIWPLCPSLPRSWLHCLPFSSQEGQAIPHLEARNIPLPGSSSSSPLTHLAAPHLLVLSLGVRLPYHPILGAHPLLVLHHGALLTTFGTLLDSQWHNCVLVYHPIPGSRPQQDHRLPGGAARLVPLTLDPRHPAEWPHSKDLWNKWTNE